MIAEWPTVRLGDHVESCLGKMLDKKKNKGTPKPYLGNSNVRWGVFDLSDLALMKFEEHEQERYGIKPGDLIVCEGGEPGRCAIWQNELPNLRIQKALHRVRTKNSLNNHYLYYWFLHAGDHGLLEPYFTGTTIKHLTGKALNNLELPLPPLGHQEFMAEVLGSLDNKIQLNHQINQTLEQMAQAIFKSWFVDFEPVTAKIAALEAGGSEEDALLAAMQVIAGDTQERANAAEGSAPEAASGDKLARLQAEQPEQYAELRATAELFPSAMQDSELGEIPEGWAIDDINGITSLIIDHRGKTPKKLGGDWADEGYIALSAKHIKAGEIVNREQLRFVEECLYRRWMKDELQKGDILLTSEGPMGEMYYLSKNDKYCLSQRLYALRANTKKIDPAYLFFWLQSPLAKSDINGRATGTTVVGIRQSELRKVRVLNPSKKLTQRFQQAIGGSLSMMGLRSKESLSLTSLRDTLLPRLLSGELSVSEAETQLTEAEAPANV